jgi:hypothetical protein
MSAQAVKEKLGLESSFPVLEKAGTLTPSTELLAEVLRPGFHVGEFTNSAMAPQALVDFLDKLGLELAEDEGSGLLFASHCGVSLHTDEKPSALWVLGGSINPHTTSHQFLVDGKSATLSVGDVYLFDARREHGLIAAETGLWAAFSVYVAPKQPR